jgi:hypothetical protein
MKKFNENLFVFTEKQLGDMKDKTRKTGISFTLDNAVASCFFLHKVKNEDDTWETESRKVAEFDLNDVFPDFLGMNEAQRFIAFYGFKQKMQDSGVNIPVTKDIEKDKIEKMGEIWDIFAAGKAPERIRTGGGNAKERQKEKDALTLELSRAIFSGDFARAKEITEAMAAKGFVENGNAAPAATSAKPEVITRKKNVKK